MSTAVPLIHQLMAKANIHANTNDNSWDYLNSLSINWRDRMREIGGRVNQAVQFLSETNNYNGEARVICEGLLADLGKHATKWRTLANGHANRSGLGKNPQEHSTILNTGLEYIQSHEEFMTNTSYAAPRLQEILVQVELRHHAMLTQLAAQEASSAQALPLNTNI